MGNIVGLIDILSGVEVPNADDRYTQNTDTLGISGSLNTSINNETIFRVAGDLALQTEINNITGGSFVLDSRYTSLTTTAGISGNLQGQINAIVQEGTTIASSGGTLLINKNILAFNIDVKDYISKTEVTTTSGGLNTSINNTNIFRAAYDSALQTEINNITGSSFVLDTRYSKTSDIVTISGGLNSRITTVENNYATKATPVSGTYNTVIVNSQGIVTSGGNVTYSGVVDLSPYTLLTTTQGVSATLNTSITNETIFRAAYDSALQTEINNITGGSFVLDNRYATITTPTSGTYNKVVVNSQGMVTSGGNISYALLSDLGAYALDTGVVHINGAESIVGGKTFNTRVNVVDGGMLFRDAISTNISTSAAELVLQQSGDTFGACRLRLRNRNAANGAIFENVSLDLVDFGFLTNTGVQHNLRFEHRSASLQESDNSAGEFQLLNAASSTAYTAFGPNKSIFRATSNATAGSNYYSPELKLRGNYWTGGASAADSWSFTDILGAGANPTSTLNIVHSGSTGVASISSAANFYATNIYNNSYNPALSGNLITYDYTNKMVDSGIASSLITTINNNYATKATPVAGTYNKVVVNSQGIVTSGGNINYAIFGSTVAGVSGDIVVHDSVGNLVDSNVLITSLAVDSGVVHINGTETIAGAKRFSSDIYVTCTGSTSASPRTVGIDSMGGSQYARFLFGDTGNAWQNGNGQATQLYSYHTLILGGDRTTITPPNFENTSNIGTIIRGTTPSTPVLYVQGAPSQIENLQAWSDSTLVAKAYVDPNGNIGTIGTLTASSLAGVSGALVVHDINGKLLDTGVPYTSLAIDSNIVHLAGSETITGLKTFNNTVSAAGYYSTLLNTTISNIFNVMGEPTGFENRTDSTLSFNNSNRTFTISGTYNIYIKGVKYVKTGETQQITNTIGQHFIYYNSSGVLTYSQGTPWNILASDVMIAMVFWDGTQGILVEERHGLTMDQSTHYYLHNVNGTERLTGFGLTGPAVQGNTDASNRYAIASGILADEDIIYTTSSLANGGPYNLAYRNGVNGDWTWTSSSTIPYFNASNSIQYNQNTGSTWQLTTIVGNNTYVNYYVIASTAVSGAQSFFIVPGQATYGSLTNAQAESFNDLSKGVFPFVEFNAVYQITYRYNNGYGTTGRARTEATPVLLSINKASAAALGNHNSLGGLQGGTAGEYYHLTSAQNADFIGKTEVTSVSGGLNGRLTTVESNYATKVTQVGGTFNNVTVNTQGVVTSGGNINYAVLSSLVLGASGDIVIHDASGYMKDSGTPITSLAVDANVVHKTGNESIAGIKTLTNRLVTTASVAGAAGINIPPGATPTSLANGDAWSTTTGFFGRVNGYSVPITKTINTLTYAGTVAVDGSLGNIQSLTLTGNAIISSPSGVPDGGNLLFRIIQGGTGSYIVTWNSNFQFSPSLPQPTLSTAVGSVDYIGFVYYAASGKFHCVSYTPFGYN